MMLIVGMFFLLGGLFFDFANIYQYHLFLERVANAAARAASTQTIVTVDGRAVLDGGRAESLAQSVLGEWASIDSISGNVAVDSGAGLVTVKVTGTYHPVFTNLITFGQGFNVSAQAQYNAVPVG